MKGGELGASIGVVPDENGNPTFNGLTANPDTENRQRIQKKIDREVALGDLENRISKSFGKNNRSVDEEKELHELLRKKGELQENVGGRRKRTRRTRRKSKKARKTRRKKGRRSSRK